MARKEQYKMVQISEDQHEKLSIIADKLGVSLTKALQMLIETQLNNLSKKKSFKVSIYTDRSGEIKMKLL